MQVRLLPGPLCSSTPPRRSPRQVVGSAMFFDNRIPTHQITRARSARPPSRGMGSRPRLLADIRMLAPQAGDAGSNPVGTSFTYTHPSVPRPKCAHAQPGEVAEPGLSRHGANVEGLKHGHEGSNPSLSTFPCSGFDRQVPGPPGRGFLPFPNAALALFRGCSSTVERLAEDQKVKVQFLPATFPPLPLR